VALSDPIAATNRMPRGTTMAVVTSWLHPIMVGATFITVSVARLRPSASTMLAFLLDPCQPMQIRAAVSVGQAPFVIGPVPFTVLILGTVAMAAAAATVAVAPQWGRAAR